MTTMLESKPALRGVGTSVYFHHHPRDRWEWLADRMAEAGLGFARMGEFCWDLFEPEPGIYDFSVLDAWIDLLNRRGIKSLLCTPTASPPDWMCLRFPSIVPVTKDGRSHGFNCRRHTCPTSPRYRDLCEGVVTAMARKYAGNESVIGWQIDNEIGHPFCFCPLCHRAFQEWLAREFGDIGRFNASVGQFFLGRTSRSFEEVPLPASDSNPCLRQVYNRFMDRQIRECWGGQVDWLRAGGVRAPITTNAMITWYGYDHEKFFEKLDAVAGDYYPLPARHPSNLFRDEHPAGTAFACAYLRGIKHGASFGFGEFRWGPSGSDPGYPTPEEHREWVHALLAGGADFISFFRFDTSPSGLERGTYGLIPSSGVLPPMFESVKRLVHDIKPLMQELSKTRVPVSPVGILYSHATHLATQDHTVWEPLRGPHGNGYSMHLATHFRAVYANHIPPDIVYPGDSFERHRVLMAPALQVVTPELAKKLEQFVQQGGILVLGMPCGVLDQQAREWEVPVPAFLDRLAGVCVEGYGLPRIHNSRLVMTPEPGVDLPRVADPAMVTRLRAYPGAEILGRYEGADRFAGWPAVVCQSHGKGRVYTLAGIVDEAALTAVLGALMRDWQLKPAIALPEGVFAMIRNGEGSEFHFFFNTTADTVRVDLPNKGTDVFTGESVRSLALAPGRSAIIRSAAL